MKNKKIYLVYFVYGLIILPFALVWLLNQAFLPLTPPYTFSELGQIKP